ncbi:bacterial transferase hexapeptide [Coniochaeta sp. 2T2.1]|nr:bacterial transferase hexapeptide [Coniochaeta sp. 2T2.1]
MSAFTALNGGSPKATTEAVSGEPSQLVTPTERTGGQIGSSETRPSRPEVSTSHRERESERDRERERERERESWSAQSHDRPPYSSANYPDVEGARKRKRSEDDEARRAPHRSPPERSEQHGPRPPQSAESRDPYGTPQREYRSYADESREHHDGWYSRGREERSSYDRRSAGPSGQTDDQIGETLRRATGQLEGSDYGTSPDGDEPSMSIYSGQYTPEQRRDGLIQSDAKKRKRNFSNRTKTGCLTCRKRKKKCDEQKPECNNCLRGGFVCAGYPPQRGTWPKPENKPTAVQIESKDPTYIPPGAYGMPQQSQQQSQQQQSPYGNQPGPNLPQQKREPLPSYRGQPLRIDPPQGRPLQTDDDRPTASTIPSASVHSPDNKLSALSVFTNPANVFPTPLSAAPLSAFTDRTAMTTPMDRTPKEYQRVPPLHDLSRTDPESSQAESLPRISVLGATRANSPSSQSQGHQSQRPESVQATAALALSHTFPSNRPRREKEEMLNGRAYYPFDKELVLERERCSAACWRFNNSTNPNIGVSPTERARLFRDILHPSSGIQISPTVTSPVTHAGRVGDNATVEAPFVCDYGYNVQIGDNVSIGRNCLINDVCEVKIGNNVLISPNVSIYTGTCTTNYRRRFGNRGTQYGKPVVIEDDCWIGANVVILPGVVIGKGVTVGAGSVVTKNLASFTICCGRAEAVVVRGISS